MENKFGDRLRYLRKKQGLSQDRLSMKVGVSATMISYYEIGKARPSSDALEWLADFFGVTTDYLLGRTDYLSSQEREDENEQIN